MTIKSKMAGLTNKLPTLAAAAVVTALGATAAMAGADATFNTALTSFTGFLEGSGGRIITVLSLAGGVVAMASGQFRLGQMHRLGVGEGAIHIEDQRAQHSGFSASIVSHCHFPGTAHVL